VPDRFTVYGVFAVLVPGVICMYLLAFTLDRAVGVNATGIGTFNRPSRPATAPLGPLEKVPLKTRLGDRKPR